MKPLQKRRPLYEARNLREDACEVRGAGWIQQAIRDVIQKMKGKK